MSETSFNVSNHDEFGNSRWSTGLAPLSSFPLLDDITESRQSFFAHMVLDSFRVEPRRLFADANGPQEANYQFMPCPRSLR